MRFCWADLAASQLEPAADFYCRLFGWQREAVDIGPEGQATILRHQGAMVASLSESTDESLVQPARWLSYIAVDDADAVARRAVDAGGAELLTHPFDVKGLGREALLRDPAGALIALWQPMGHDGFEAWGVPGALCSHELATSEPQRAIDFYRKTLGWRARREEAHRWLFERDGVRVAHVVTTHADDEPGSEWRVGVGVPNMEQYKKRAAELGAEVGRDDGPIRDPQGATLLFVETQ